MSERRELIPLFLNRHKIKDYKIDFLAGDCSYRKYYRVQKKHLIPDALYDVDRAVLMDAPPQFENAQRFHYLSDLLSSHGLSVPHIYYHDFHHGFLLMEDFGDARFRVLLERGEKSQEELLKLAVETLSVLHEKFPQNYVKRFEMMHHDMDVLMQGLDVMVDWFLPFQDSSFSEVKKRDAFRAQLHQLMQSHLEAITNLPQTIVLRDYHVDNLMFLKDRSGIQACGLLDFQDASIGSPAYDLLSLLQDARFDIDQTLAAHFLNVFLEKRHYDKASFLHAYDVLGLQRNLRILGVFARRFVRDHVPDYMAYIPRVLSYLHHTLQKESFAPLADLLMPYLQFESNVVPLKVASR